MKYAFGKTLILMLGLIFSVGLAHAQPTNVDSNTLYIPSQDFPITIITWQSSWTDLDYTTGDDVDVDLMWEVVQGAAECAEDGIGARKKAFTPGPVTGMIDETSCNNPTVEPAAPGSAQATVRFDTLKDTGAKGGPRGGADPKKSKGNAHLGLSLMVDSTGDGIPNLEVVLGVNVHVCDNGDPGFPCLPE